MAAVGDRLANHGIDLIGVDQRGVLRSDALAEGAAPTVAQLVDDFEHLRQALGVERWAILGHSAGGGYALDYALAHPDALNSAIFDCPSWDCDATDRTRLPVAADLLDAAGKHDAATTCREQAALPGRLGFSMECLTAMQQLGEEYLRLFTYDAAGEAAYTQLAKSAPETLDWSKGASHLPLVEDMYQDRTPRLAGLAVPSLLLHGETDLVAPQSVIDQYRRLVRAPHDVATISHAGHFAWAEQPDRYADIVAEFVSRCGEPAQG